MYDIFENTYYLGPNDHRFLAGTRIIDFGGETVPVLYYDIGELGRNGSGANEETQLEWETRRRELRYEMHGALAYPHRLIVACLDDLSNRGADSRWGYHFQSDRFGPTMMDLAIIDNKLILNHARYDSLDDYYFFDIISSRKAFQWNPVSNPKSPRYVDQTWFNERGRWVSSEYEYLYREQ